MRVIVDFDNTICQYGVKFEDRWRSMYNEDIKFDGSMTCLPKDTDLFFNNFYTINEINPYPNAINALKKLNEICDVVICTHSENKNVTDTKTKLIINWLGEEWRNKIISIEGYTCDKTKYEGDIMIEDNPNIEEVWSMVYFSQIYNTHKTSLIPGFNWNKINELIDYIERNDAVKWGFLDDLNIKTYCLCIEERRDRIITVKQEFKRVGLIKYVEFDIQKKDKSFNGRKGIWDAHINHMSDQHINLIFEDDVKFIGDWVNKLKYIKTFLYSKKKWDFLRLGGIINSFNEKTDVPFIWNITTDLLHAYFINTSGCVKMYKDKTPYTWSSQLIDEYIMERDDILDYSIYPDICIQRNDIVPSSNVWCNAITTQKIIENSWFEWWQQHNNKYAYLTRFLSINLQKKIHPFFILKPVILIVKLYNICCKKLTT